jgi:two-component system, response regulator
MTPLILLVEDDPADIELAALALACMDNTLHVEDSGEKAAQYLFADTLVVKPTLILLDLKLPGLGGLELLRMIRSNHDTRRIPVIVLSGSSLDDDVRAAFGIGAKAYMQKPVTLPKLVEQTCKFGFRWTMGA